MPDYIVLTQFEDNGEAQEAYDCGNSLQFALDLASELVEEDGIPRYVLEKVAVINPKYTAITEIISDRIKVDQYGVPDLPIKVDNEPEITDIGNKYGLIIGGIYHQPVQSIEIIKDLEAQSGNYAVPDIDFSPYVCPYPDVEPYNLAYIDDRPWVPEHWGTDYIEMSDGYMISHASSYEYLYQFERDNEEYVKSVQQGDDLIEIMEGWDAAGSDEHKVVAIKEVN